MGVLPFDNNVVEMQLTGQQVMDGIHNLIVSGITTVNGFKHDDETDLDPDSVYTVLTTDYLYARPYFNFQYDDTEPYNTSVNYRQPLIDWIRSLNTSTGDPLETYLDTTGRR